jgi:hypothetical protein
LITILPKGAGVLQTNPGVFSNPVGLHQAVVTPSGGVIDPLVGASYPSVEAFVNATVPASAPYVVDIGGKIVT